MRGWLASVLVVSAFLASVPGRTDEVYTFVVKKQEEKRRHGWSLSEWLETRDRMRLMDLWLALHSPSPFEFYLGGDYQFAQTASAGRQSYLHFSAAAFASIFGLAVERSLSPLNEWTGSFQFRPFGYHDQATNLTLHAGLRSRDEPAALRSAAAGVSVTVYLAKFFGLSGLYRHYFESVVSDSGAKVSGQRYEGTAFIDFSFLRVYGTYFSAPETGAGTQGALIGTRLYF